MPRRTKEEAEQTRAEILTAALDLFSTKGYSKTTFDDIAKAINMTKGAIYWHFRNKPDLLAGLIQVNCESKVLAILNAMPLIRSLEELKEFFVCNAKDIASDARYRTFLFFVFFQMEWSDTLFMRIRNTINFIRDFPMKHLKDSLTVIQKSGELSPETDLDALTVIVIGIWKGLLSSYIGKEFDFNLPEMVSRAFDILVRGLKNNENR